MNDEQDVYEFYADPEHIVATNAAPVRRQRRANLSSHVPIRFPDDVIRSARQLATEDGVSISTWIRNLVVREVKRRSADYRTDVVVTWKFELTEPKPEFTYETRAPERREFEPVGQ